MCKVVEEYAKEYAKEHAEEYAKGYAEKYAEERDKKRIKNLILKGKDNAYIAEAFDISPEQVDALRKEVAK